MRSRCGVKAAVVQVALGGDRSENLDRACQKVEAARRAGAELVVLPELSSTRYRFESREEVAAEAEEAVSGPAAAFWIPVARRLGVHLVLGVLERSGKTYYNSALLVSPEGVRAVYRKAHLYDWEKRWLTPGDSPITPVEIPGARLGILICYDLRFVEAARLLALRGADAICVPAAWSDAHKKRPVDERGLCGASYLAVGTAYAHRVFVLGANRVGSERGVSYLGCSLIAGPAGVLLAGPSSRDTEDLLLAELDLQEARNKKVSPVNDVLRDRRPESYGTLLGTIDQ